MLNFSSTQYEIVYSNEFLGCYERNPLVPVGQLTGWSSLLLTQNAIHTYTQAGSHLAAKEKANL